MYLIRHTFKNYLGLDRSCCIPNKYAACRIVPKEASGLEAQARDISAERLRCPRSLYIETTKRGRQRGGDENPSV